MAGRRPNLTAQPCSRQAHGFTMIELLAVLGILAVLLVMALPFAELTARREREAELQHGLWEIRDAIDGYKRMADAGLIQQSPKSGYPPDLQTLVAGVKTNTATMAYFLRSVPQDPFAPSAPDGGWALRSYHSPPDQPEAGEDVFDVHTRSTEIGLNGIALAQW
ncbi:MAG: type II secretion system GspH family protein [Pseudomonadota bacterium]|nr:type II secretion system GspH family protein [Pseudomonadota bacterium]